MKSLRTSNLLPSRLRYRNSKYRVCFTRDIEGFGLYAGVRHKSSGFTLIELMVVIAIIGILAGFGIPAYMGYLEKAKVVTAVAEIKDINSAIEAYRASGDDPPPDLNAVNYQNLLDPWENPYQYLNIEALGGGGKGGKGGGQIKVDANNNDVNTDFDLYSMGKDGVTNKKLDHSKSEDDIIRGDNGTFFGPVFKY